MKIKIFLNIILIITFACNKSSNNDKNKILNVETENCAHIENKEIYPPNPPFNFQIAKEKIELKTQNRNFELTIKLIADQNIDYKGQSQQNYVIKTENLYRKQKLYFALPTEYKKYCGNLKIYKYENYAIIGFEDKSIINCLYKISLHKDEEFNNGLVEIKYVLEKKQKKELEKHQKF